jgi:hypothetical protein
MVSDEMWQEAVSLTKMVFRATPSFDVSTSDHWQIVVAVQLHEAHERLNSIGMLLDKGYVDSAHVLARSLFEIALNMAYIEKDVEQRLPEYLKHGGFPLSEEDAEQLEQKLSEESLEEVRGMVPERAWRSIREMCCDLGWSGEYGTFYRYLSVVEHGGSFRLMTNFLKLLEREPVPQWERASVLLYAVCLYLRVSEVAAKVSPSKIRADKIADLTGECYKMMESFAES